MQVSFSHRLRSGTAALALLLALRACVSPTTAPHGPPSAASASQVAAPPAVTRDESGASSAPQAVPVAIAAGSAVPSASPSPVETASPVTRAAPLALPSLLNDTWDARCPRAAAADRAWDYPDRLRKAHVVLKATPATALRGYLFWSNKTEACLRIDLRTVPEERRSDIGTGQPVLRGTLAFEAGLQPVGQALQFDIPEPLFDHVYSLSVPVRCTASKRSECRAVYISVTHPSAAFGGGITIEARDGAPLGTGDSGH